jgi:hypothetical protein
MINMFKSFSKIKMSNFNILVIGIIILYFINIINNINNNIYGININCPRIPIKGKWRLVNPRIRSIPFPNNIKTINTNETGLATIPKIDEQLLSVEYVFEGHSCLEGNLISKITFRGHEWRYFPEKGVDDEIVQLSFKNHLHVGTQKKHDWKLIHGVTPKMESKLSNHSITKVNTFEPNNLVTSTPNMEEYPPTSIKGTWVSTEYPGLGYEIITRYIFEETKCNRGTFIVEQEIHNNSWKIVNNNKISLKILEIVENVDNSISMGIVERNGDLLKDTIKLNNIGEIFKKIV